MSRREAEEKQIDFGSTLATSPLRFPISASVYIFVLVALTLYWRMMSLSQWMKF